MNHRLQWDIFCKVIDNFGDIGVCWRLAADLAGRGQQVRLWVDDASALAWMAPNGCQGVRVLPWTARPDLASAGFEQQPPDVLVEAFGCAIAPEFIASSARTQRTTGKKPVWINLEYLSAESYVERSHAMPSPVQGGPAAGWTKWFFYPGFSAATGGLLREPGLMARQAGFDRDAWLAAHGISRKGSGSGEILVSLFCYAPPALGGLLEGWAVHGLEGKPVRLLVAAGRAENAVKTVFSDENCALSSVYGHGLLSISYLPWLTQAAYDELLWACDLNFVRGEDSLARALWAAKPFVWQIYPQHDDAHLHKLKAFLDWLQAPPTLRAFHAAWNRPACEQDAAGNVLIELRGWQSCAIAARARLLAQPDLSSRLLEFVAKKR
ncbi:MAG: elongation factor P maturation arginine rhamnosyltransferase EarP [Polaromonas sp.]